MIQSDLHYLATHFNLNDIISYMNNKGSAEFLRGREDLREFEVILREGYYNYTVKLELDEDFDLKSESCTCRDYRVNKSCWHIIKAVELVAKYLERSGVYSEQKAINALDAAYSNENIEYEPKEMISLKVRLEYSTSSGLFMEIKLGNSKFYIMRSIPQFLDAKENMTKLKYGKNFTYNPKIHYFSDLDERFLLLLSASYRPHQERYSHEKLCYFNDASLKLFMELLKDMHFGFWCRELRIFIDDIEVVEGNPDIDISIERKKDGFLFKTTNKPFIPLSSDLKYIYFEGKIYETDIEYRNSIKPLADSLLAYGDNKLLIKSDDMPKFTNNVLVKINRAQKVKMSEELKQEFSINPLNARFELDKKGDNLIGKLEFKYGDNVIQPFSKPELQSEEIVVRDIEKEESIKKYLENSLFKVKNGIFYIDNEEDIYNFFLNSDELLKFEGLGVYYSEDLRRTMERANAPVKSEFRYNNDIDMLEFSLDLPNVSEEELNQIFMSLKKKKKYYRLKSGDFISLERGIFNDLNGLEESGDLDYANLSMGRLKFPLYRAIYLENYMKERENVDIKENFKIKELINDIRNGTEVDFKLPENLSPILRDYQIKGYRFLRTLHRYGFGGVLADEMGLGKTLQMIAFFQAMANEGYGQSLIVVPTSLVSNWISEFKKFAPTLKVAVIKGMASERKALIENSKSSDVVLTSYPLMRNDFPEYKDNYYETVVLDEGQYIKNHTSLNAKSVKTLNAKSRFVLTGTPMENTLSELHSVFDFLMPGYLLNHAKFVKVYEKPIIDGNEEALKSLKDHIGVFMLRRIKQEVLIELPDKIEQEIKVDLTEQQKKLYAAYLQTVKSDVKKKLEEKGYQKSRFEILSLLTRLRQICQDPAIFLEEYRGGSGKIDTLMDLINELKDTGRRALIFSSFTTVLGRIEERLDKSDINYQYLDGAVPQDQRGERVEAFNRGEGDVFLISLRAGGTGLNLATADTVIHFDPWWNPAVEDQATDRAHRIGQKHNVLVIRLVAEGTIEEKIYELQSKKRSLIDKVIEDGETAISKLTEEEILKLLE